MSTLVTKDSNWLSSFHGTTVRRWTHQEKKKNNPAHFYLHLGKVLLHSRVTIYRLFFANKHSITCCNLISSRDSVEFRVSKQKLLIRNQQELWDKRQLQTKAYTRPISISTTNWAFIRDSCKTKPNWMVSVWTSAFRWTLCQITR